MQMAIAYEFKPERREPRFPLSSQSQLWTLIGAFKRGERLTVMTALEHYQIFALSQRVGELKNLGWDVRSQMVKIGSGKKIAEYSLANNRSDA